MEEYLTEEYLSFNIMTTIPIKLAKEIIDKYSMELLKYKIT